MEMFGMHEKSRDTNKNDNNNPKLWKRTISDK